MARVTASRFDFFVFLHLPSDLSAVDRRNANAGRLPNERLAVKPLDQLEVHPAISGSG